MEEEKNCGKVGRGAWGSLKGAVSSNTERRVKEDGNRGRAQVTEKLSGQ